jgi:hypothetical protein
LELTSHALLRCDQRRISMADIDLVMNYGTRVHNGGALFCFMRKRDISGDLQPGLGGRLEGLTVVLDPAGESVITVYRNKRGLREIKRKLQADGP